MFTNFSSTVMYPVCIRDMCLCLSMLWSLSLSLHLIVFLSFFTIHISILLHLCLSLTGDQCVSVRLLFICNLACIALMNWFVYLAHRLYSFLSYNVAKDMQRVREGKRGRERGGTQILLKSPKKMQCSVRITQSTQRSAQNEHNRLW